MDDVTLFMILFMKNVKVDFTGLLLRGWRGEEGKGMEGEETGGTREGAKPSLNRIWCISR